MSSVVRPRHMLQWLSHGFVVLALAALFGCQPAAEKKTEKKATSTKPLAETPAKTPAAEPAQPMAIEKPAAATPTKDVPTAEPAKEPPAKTSASVAPVAAKIGGDGAGGDLAAAARAVEIDPTNIEPTVKWLPKPVENADAEAKDEAGMKKYAEKVGGTDVMFDMVPIKGGTFEMGSPEGEKDRQDDEGPQVEVKLDAFWMGKCEVTWNEYELWGAKLDKQRREAARAKPNAWNKAADAVADPTNAYSDMTFGMGKEGYPAVCMTQFAAKMYCRWLSAKTGRYYRLPTEAEWEYACRAGTTSAYSFGDDAEKLGDNGWYDGNSDEKYHKVGEKKANAWGLHDMHGNVCEWCLDQYVADRYKQLAGKLAVNPLLPVTKEYPQVVRGGGWTDEAAKLRSAARRGSTKDWKTQDPQIPQSIWYFTDANFVGFRVVRPLKTPSVEEAAQYDVTEFEKQELIDYKKAQAGKE